MKRTVYRRTLGTTTLALLLGAFGVASCDEGPEITGNETNFSGQKDKKKDKDKDLGDEDEGGPLYDDDGELRVEKLGGDLTKGDLTAAKAGDAKVLYPLMDLYGNGNTTCKDKVYGIIGQYTNTIDEGKIDLNFYNGKVTGAGKGEKKANEKIQAKLGETIYQRVTADQRVELNKAKFDFKAYAMFATSATKTKAGTVFNFASPLPVFPFPAAPSRYAELGKGPHSWTSQVTGTFTFTVTMTIELVSSSDDSVVIKFTSTIPEDTDRSLYEAWPLAKEAIYTMNPKALEIQQIASINWFNDNDSCSGPETLNINFKLCKKTLGDKTQDYPCQ